MKCPKCGNEINPETNECPVCKNATVNVEEKIETNQSEQAVDQEQSKNQTQEINNVQSIENTEVPSNEKDNNFKIENNFAGNKKKSNKIFLYIIIFVLIIGFGFYIYITFINKDFIKNLKKEPESKVVAENDKQNKESLTLKDLKKFVSDKATKDDVIKLYNYKKELTKSLINYTKENRFEYTLYKQENKNNEILEDYKVVIENMGKKLEDNATYKIEMKEKSDTIIINITKNTTNTTQSTDKNQTQSSTTKPSSGSTSASVEDKNIVDFKDHKINISSSKYTYIKSNSIISISPVNSSSWYGGITVIKSQYSIVKDTKDDVKEQYIKDGYTVSKYDTITKGTTEWTYFELTRDNINSLNAYTKLNDEETILFTVVSKDGKYRYDLLPEFAEIVKKSK